MDPTDQRKDKRPESGLEEDLQSIRNQLSTQGDQEPPLMLDQAVLNTARRELAGRKSRPLRWIGAFATASVVVLALTLVIQQQQAPAPPEAGRADGVRLDRTSENQSELREQQLTAPSADTDQAGSKSQVGEDARQRMQLPVQATPGRRKAEEETKRDNEPQAAQAPPPAAPRSEFSAEFRDVESAQAEPANAAAATTAPAKKAVSGGKEQDLIAGQSRREGDDLPSEPTGTEQPAELNQRTGTAKTVQDELESVPPSPAEWVNQMLELRKNEQFGQLRRELEAFQAAYPEFALPPELAGFAE